MKSEQRVRIGVKEPSKYFYSVGMILSDYTEAHLTATKKTYQTMRNIVSMLKCMGLTCSKPKDINIREDGLTKTFIYISVKRRK
jgi:hypothetical protein